MFRKKMVVALAFVLSAIMLFNSGLVVNANNHVYAPTGSDIIVDLPDHDFISRTFTVSRFNHVIVGGNWIVTYVQAPNHAIRVEMPSCWFDNYNFNVRSRTLRVERRGFLPGLNNLARPRIYVYAPSLESVNLSGFAVAKNWSPVTGRNFTINISGAAEADLNLQIDRTLTVNASGTSQLTMSGATRDLRINAAGVVNISAFELQAREARPVNVTGIGTVEISVSDRLNVQAAGTARVYYKGNPRVTQRVAGGARVINVVN